MEQTNTNPPPSDNKNTDQNNSVKPTSSSEGVEAEEQRHPANQKWYNIHYVKPPVLSWWRKALEPLAIGQFIIALLTIGTLCWLIFSTNKQLRKTETALQYTKTADCLAVLTYQKSIVSNSTDSMMRVRDTLARDMAVKIDLRAYLVCDSFPTVQIEKNKTMMLYVKIKNVGKTLAKNIKILLADSILLDITKKDIDFMIKRADTIGGGCLGYEQWSLCFHESKHILSEEEFMKVRSDFKHVFFVGIIIYSDVFNIQHKTSFCAYLSYYISPKSGNMVAYPQYNDND